MLCLNMAGYKQFDINVTFTVTNKLSMISSLTDFDYSIWFFRFHVVLEFKIGVQFYSYDSV